LSSLALTQTAEITQDYADLTRLGCTLLLYPGRESLIFWSGMLELRSGARVYLPDTVTTSELERGKHG
jgi:hypothetical protein